MSETLDLRTATKIEVTKTRDCPMSADCFLSHIYRAIIGFEDYGSAVEIATGEPNVKTEKLDKNRTLVVCQVVIEKGSACGGMIIKRSLLERNPHLIYTAKNVITRGNVMVENPNFGRMN